MVCGGHQWVSIPIIISGMDFSRTDQQAFVYDQLLKSQIQIQDFFMVFLLDNICNDLSQKPSYLSM